MSSHINLKSKGGHLPTSSCSGNSISLYVISTVFGLVCKIIEITWGFVVMTHTICKGNIPLFFFSFTLIKMVGHWYLIYLWMGRLSPEYWYQARKGYQFRRSFDQSVHFWCCLHIFWTSFKFWVVNNWFFVHVWFSSVMKG